MTKMNSIIWAHSKNWFIKGNYFLLGGENNYWHLLIDYLPRLICLKKINVKEIYISKNDYLENLITDIDIKLNKINNLMLSSKFPNNSELKLSITKNSNDEKITTLNTKNASPLVKKYKFINFWLENLWKRGKDR